MDIAAYSYFFKINLFRHGFRHMVYGIKLPYAVVGGHGCYGLVIYYVYSLAQALPQRANKRFCL